MHEPDRSLPDREAAKRTLERNQRVIERTRGRAEQVQQAARQSEQIVERALKRLNYAR